MDSESPTERAAVPGPEYFATTHWSVVLTAQRHDSTRADAALSHLCQTYWYPLYAFVRRQGHSAHDAQDLTQEFFARLLAKNYLAVADRERVTTIRRRFRSSRRQPSLDGALLFRVAKRSHAWHTRC